MTSKIRYVGCSSTGALVFYVADDGTWDGTAEDAVRLPIVDVGRDLVTDEEDMSREEIVEAFARKGIKAEW